MTENLGDSLKNAMGAVINVYGSDMKIFKSTEQTGDGSPHDIAHGLPAAPTVYFIVPSKVAVAGDTFVVNSVNGTNVNITISTGSKGFIIAF